MTSIYDISYDDITKFLLANNKNFKSDQDAYDKAFNLLKDKKAKGHTISIIEWMIAYNLLLNNVDIPYYSINDIDIMSQNEINKLAKLLTMKGNNRSNIKNILRYLHKLEEVTPLLPDVNNLILSTLSQLELQDIKISHLSYAEIINLLKKHRNKKEIRKFLDKNMEKIIIHITLYFNINNYRKNNIDYEDFPHLLEYITIYNKYMFIKIIEDTRKELKIHYTDKEIDDLIEEINENTETENEKVYIGKNEMNDLVDFTLDLIEINEIGLAKKVFDISNNLHYVGRKYPYNFELIDMMMKYYKIELLSTILNFIGEGEFISGYFGFAMDKSGNNTRFLRSLVELEKYDLLIKILQIYIDENHKGMKQYLNKTLQKIKKSIKENNKSDIIDQLYYLDDLDHLDHLDL